MRKRIGVSIPNKQKASPRRQEYGPRSEGSDVKVGELPVVVAATSYLLTIDSAWGDWVVNGPVILFGYSDSAPLSISSGVKEVDAVSHRL